MPTPTLRSRALAALPPLALALGGCGLPGVATPAASTSRTVPASSGTPSPHATPARATASTATGTPPPVSGTVVHVSDGDTLDIVTGNGRRQRVRLLGVDAPEVAHGGTRAACGGDAARTALRSMALHGTVVVTKDAHTAFHDRYGRLLGYVTLGRSDLSMWLVRRGLAEAWRPRSAHDPARWQSYVAAAAAAKAHHAGSWRTCARLGR